MVLRISYLQCVRACDGASLCYQISKCRATGAVCRKLARWSFCIAEWKQCNKLPSEVLFIVLAVCEKYASRFTLFASSPPTLSLLKKRQTLEIVLSATFHVFEVVSFLDCLCGV